MTGVLAGLALLAAGTFVVPRVKSCSFVASFNPGQFRIFPASGSGWVRAIGAVKGRGQVLLACPGDRALTLLECDDLGSCSWSGLDEDDQEPIV